MDVKIGNSELLPNWAQMTVRKDDTIFGPVDYLWNRFALDRGDDWFNVGVYLYAPVDDLRSVTAKAISPHQAARALDLIEQEWAKPTQGCEV